MATDSHVFCKNLSLSFNYQKIFSDISFELKQSSALAVTGKNGSGKTTLLKTLSGLLKPTSGTVSCCGETIWPRLNNYTHKSIYFGYTPAFYMDQSVQANFDFYLKCFGNTIKPDETTNTLKKVDLYHKRNESVSNLSTGQKRRLTCAILLNLAPNIIFIDEPTNGLDSSGIHVCLETFDYLKSVHKTTLIISTHDKTLQSWCTQTLHLKNKIETHNCHKQNITTLL